MYRRLLAAGSLVALAAGMSLAVAGPAGGGTSSETFEFEDETQTFTVPDNVCEIRVIALGAGGGDSTDSVLAETVPGGTGGRAEATIPVTPGETLTVRVGGEGEDTVTVGGTGGLGGEGGFNGGADGGDATVVDAGGGGGGGASDVRRDEERLVVAGGGGGAGGEANGPADIAGAGGDGGGSEGEDGDAGATILPVAGAEGGEGGSQTEGGDGGAEGFPQGGDDGELGEGGDGGSLDPGASGGGGGGGGYYGGGGGAGEDLPLASAGGGGGGGSGFTPDGTGLEEGDGSDDDGEVTISWTAGQGCPAPAAAPAAVVVQPRFTG
jgi:hypothetical protein